ncbi:MAG TPA: hypothetical protein VGV92_05650 [Gammaproteobacteria bacterium]|nr:hypothetical protein [Gammaproteobacteria bacterium]
MISDELIESFLQEINSLNVEVESKESQLKLKSYIKKAYEIVSADGAITDWQNIQIFNAVWGYAVGFFSYSICSLLSVFDDKDEISKQYAYRHEKTAKEITEKFNLDKLISSL